MRLKKEAFTRWLSAKLSTEIVGENRDSHSCPIANFYFAASGGSEIVIFRNEWGDYIIDRGYDKRSLPVWAADFAFVVDGAERGKITVGRALSILAGTDQENAG